MTTEPSGGMGEDFGVLLGRAYGACVQELREALSDAGFDDLGRWYGYVLRALQEDELSLRELAPRLGMTSPGAIKIVDEMERDRYIERFPDPRDGRVKRLRLSDRGRHVLEQAQAFHRSFESRLAAALGPADATAVRRALSLIVSDWEDTHEPVPLGPI